MPCHRPGGATRPPGPGQRRSTSTCEERADRTPGPARPPRSNDRVGGQKRPPEKHGTAGERASDTLSRSVARVLIPRAYRPPARRRSAGRDGRLFVMPAAAGGPRTATQSFQAPQRGRRAAPTATANRADRPQPVGATSPRSALLRSRGSVRRHPLNRPCPARRSPRRPPPALSRGQPPAATIRTPFNATRLLAVAFRFPSKGHRSMRASCSSAGRLP
jgi:hypothetical protein